MYTIEHQMQLNAFQSQPQVGLLYFENLEHFEQNSQKSIVQNIIIKQKSSIYLFIILIFLGVENKVCDEIQFNTMVRIQLIRIVRPGHNVYQHFKKIYTVTQSDRPIKSLEIFGRQYTKPSSRYTLIFSNMELQIEGCDILIPIEQGFITDFLVFRGLYKRLTICVYGDIVQYKPVLQFGLNDLKQLSPYPASKCAIVRIYLRKGNKVRYSLECGQHLTTFINRGFDLNNIFFLKGFNQQESQKQIELLANELKNIDSEYDFVDKQLLSLYHDKLEQLNKILFKHLRHSKADIHQPAHFKDVDTIYKLIPKTLVDSVIFALKASYSSAIRAFPIIINLMSSKLHALLFLEQGGLNLILECLYDKEKQLLPTYFKIKVIETIYNSLNHIEYCNELIQDKQMEQQDDKNNESEKSQKKKKKKDKKKDKKSKKDGKKKKAKKNKSRSRSRSKSADQRKSKSVEQDDSLQTEQIKKMNGIQIIAYTMARAEDEKIVQACYMTLNRLQLYLRFRKLKNNLDLLYQQKLQFNDQLQDTIPFFIQNIQQHCELENLMFQELFLFVIQKDFYCDRQRELTYSLFDAEKTKVSNSKLVKEILQMRDKQFSYANARWFKQMDFLKYIGAMMAYVTQIPDQNLIFQQCCELLQLILSIKGGVCIIFQETHAFKLIIHTLTRRVQTHSNEAHTYILLNLLKSHLNILNTLDLIYFKLLGYDYDYELIKLLSQLQTFTEEQDEKSQKGLSINYLIHNEFFSEALFYTFNQTRFEDLLEKEVEVTILTNIFINILRFNNHPRILSIADRIIPINARYVKFINQDKSKFTVELRLSQILLSAILEPYELFLAKDTTKGIREQFHFRLKFITVNQDPDKNKLKEYFGVGEHKKGIYEELKQEFKLIGLYDYPSQNIQFLDGSIKIFYWLIKSNKFYFIPFFENEVIAGIECFASKLSVIFSALLSKNIQAEYMTLKLKNLPKVMRDYFDLTFNTLILIEERLRFRHSLGCENSFHSTDLGKILIDLWVTISKVMKNPEQYSSFSVFSKQSTSLYNCHEKAKEFLLKLRACFNYIIALNSFQDDQENPKLSVKQGNQEVQILIHNLYINAYRSQEDLEFIIQLLQYIVKDNAHRPNFKQNLFDVLFKPMRKNDDEFENYTKNGDLGFLIDSMGDQKCLQNILQTSTQTFDDSHRKQLFLLLQNLLEMQDHQITLQLFKMFEENIRSSSQKIKLVAKNDEESFHKFKYDWLLIALFQLQTIDVCIQDPLFKYILNYEHLNDDLAKILNLIDDIIDHCDDPKQRQEYNFKLLVISLKNQLLQIFCKIFDHERGFNYLIKENSNNYLIEDIPHIMHQQQVIISLSRTFSKCNKIFDDNTEKEYQHLLVISINLALQILCQCAKNTVGQNIILYSEYSQNFYKPKPIISFTIIVELILNIKNNYEQLQYKQDFYNILHSFCEFNARMLLQQSSKQEFIGDLRKKAMQQLLFDKKSPELVRQRVENIVDLYQNIIDSLHDTQEFNKQTQILLFLKENFMSQSTNESTQNVQLPSQPRPHEQIFQMVAQLKQNNNDQASFVQFFKQTVLENDKINKYQAFITSEITPWKQYVKEDELFQPTTQFIFPKLQYKEYIFRLQEFEIPPHPKMEINQVLTLNVRAPLQSKDRNGFAKHFPVLVVQSQQTNTIYQHQGNDQSRNYMMLKNIQPVPQPAVQYRPENMYCMQQPSVNPHANPIGEVPIIPVRQNHLLDIAPPPQGVPEDPRLRPANYQPPQQQLPPQQPIINLPNIPNLPGNKMNIQQSGNMPLNMIIPPHQNNIQQIPMGYHQQQLYQQQMQQQQYQPQQFQQGITQSAQQGYQQYIHLSQIANQQLQKQSPQLQQSPLLAQQQLPQQQLPQQQIQLPQGIQPLTIPQPQQQQQQPQQQVPQQQAQAQQPLQAGQGDQQLFLQQLISGMNEDEKLILKNYLNSRDPNRNRDLQQFRTQYPRIDQFLTALKPRRGNERQ